MDGLIFLAGLVLFLVFVVFPILTLISLSRTGRQQQQLIQLQQQVAELRQLLQRASTGEPERPQPAPASRVSMSSMPAAAAPPGTAVQSAAAPERAAAVIPSAVPSSPPRPSQAAAPRQQQKERENPLSGILSWLLKGNPLAKLGILLLFFGLAYLMKYTIERDMFPIELRLMSASAVSLVLLGLGWRLRLKQPVYALILQGGAVGALYITVFGAFQLYHLLPHLLAFGLMLVICAASVGLAVLQRALSLAVLASLGGYLAPLLLSSNSGNFIGLFSYYLLISCGILAVSVWQSWRVLNLLGFAFTFGVGGLWGIQHYQPEYYLSIQLFLIANLVIFGILTLSFAVRHQHQQQAAIDGTLLFGTPLVGFGMQYAITEHWAFGPAFSSVAFGLLYLLLAGWMLRRYPELGRRMAISCLALGAAFATLAIPLALSAEWTALAWSLEGAGIVWAGLMQGQRRMSWSGSGVLLLAAGAVTQAALDGMSNAAFLLAFAILALCWLSAGALWRRYPLEKSYWLLQSRVLLIGGILAWLWLIVDGVERLLPDVFEDIKALAALALMVLSVWCWHLAARRLLWRELGYAVWLLLPVALLALGVQQQGWGHPLDAGWWSLSWLALFISAVPLLKQAPWLMLSPRWLAGLHLALFWLALLWLGCELEWRISQLPWGYVDWKLALALTSMAAVILAVWLAAEKGCWPLSEQGPLYWRLALLPLLPCILLLLLVANLQDGQVPNWMYLPLFNPLEESAIFALLMLAFWRRRALYFPAPQWLSRLYPYSCWLLWALAAWWANGALLRALAYYANLGWSIEILWGSRLIQTTFALVWMLTALVLMLWSTRRAARSLWFCGAALLGIVIVKLFLIDSAQGGGLARAVAFIGVAILVLIVGYFAPLPPRQGSDKKELQV